MALMDSYKTLVVYGNKNKFYFVKVVKQYIMAWEEMNINCLEMRYLSLGDFDKGEEFLKSIGRWEEFEKYQIKPETVEKELIVESNTNRTLVENKNESGNIMTKIRIDTPVDSDTVVKVSDKVQEEIKRGRGRPKGAKNKPKEMDEFATERLEMQREIKQSKKVV